MFTSVSEDAENIDEMVENGSETNIDDLSGGMSIIFIIFFKVMIYSFIYLTFDIKRAFMVCKTLINV